MNANIQLFYKNNLPHIKHHERTGSQLCCKGKQDPRASLPILFDNVVINDHTAARSNVKMCDDDVRGG